MDYTVKPLTRKNILEGDHYLGKMSSIGEYNDFYSSPGLVEIIGPDFLTIHSREKGLFTVKYPIDRVFFQVLARETGKGAADLIIGSPNGRRVTMPNGNANEKLVIIKGEADRLFDRIRA